MTQPVYPLQLAEYYLNSEELYSTQAGLDVLLNFDDDDNIIVCQEENQYSQGLNEWLDLEIDRLFKRDGCPDVFSSESLNELRIIIAEKLSDLDLTKAIIH